MVCRCVSHRGHRVEARRASSTPCRHDIRMGLPLVRSWARVQRASPGRESSEGGTLGACRCMSLLRPRTMPVCTCVESAEICCRVTASGCVSMPAVQPMLFSFRVQVCVGGLAVCAVGVSGDVPSV